MTVVTRNGRGRPRSGRAVGGSRRAGTCPLDAGRALRLITPMLLWACAPVSHGVPEGEGASPGCPYAVDRSSAEGPARPTEPACVVDIEGGRSRRALHFDAQGRRIGWVDLDGRVRTVGHSRLRERRFAAAQSARDGHVKQTLEIIAVAAQPPRHGVELCAVDTEQAGVAIRRTLDLGCDCRDVFVALDCTVGPHGPLRCEHVDRDRGLERVETWAYDTAGRVRRHASDRDLDGVADFTTTTVYDSDGRPLEERIDCPVCTGSRSIRTTWLHQVDPRRETMRRDRGDDGSAETVERTTWDAAGRVVLSEAGTDLGFTHETSTTYTDDGGHRAVEIRDGVVVSSTTVVIDGRRTTTIETVKGRTAVLVVDVDADGRVARRARMGPDGMTETAWVRDGRGWMVERRERAVHDGVERGCRVRYDWHEACPAEPIDAALDGCRPK